MKKTKKVDKQRLSIIQSLFSEMGFTGLELQMRVRTFVVFHSLELEVFVRQTREERLKMLRLRHAFFTRPWELHRYARIKSTILVAPNELTVDIPPVADLDNDYY